MHMIEVIVQNGKEAVEAERLGVDQLELVASIKEGGLTPSYGTIKQVLNSVSIPVHIMIRPHSYHYVYNRTDLQIIKEDIYNILELGGRHIVFGALEEDGIVNVNLLEQVLAISSELKVTFHRAFDEVPSLIDAYHTLTNYKGHITSILTSGGKSNCTLGKENLRQLVKCERLLKGPSIKPGAGLNVGNISDIAQTVQATCYHFGRAVRVNQSFAQPIDSIAVKQFIHILRKDLKHI